MLQLPLLWMKKWLDIVEDGTVTGNQKVADVLFCCLRRDRMIAPLPHAFVLVSSAPTLYRASYGVGSGSACLPVVGSTKAGVVGRAWKTPRGDAGRHGRDRAQEQQAGRPMAELSSASFLVWRKGLTCDAERLDIPCVCLSLERKGHAGLPYWPEVSKAMDG